MKIGFLCKHNPYDRNSFSGTPYYMLAALSALPEVEMRVLGGHKRPGVASKLLGKLRGARAPQPEQFDAKGLDFVLSVVSSELIAPVAARTPGARIVHITDATPQFLRDFYGWEVDPTRDETERLALTAAHLAIYSSEFMAETAAREFGPELAPKMRFAPFGVNIGAPPAEAAEKPPLTKLRLLFVGKDWARKGGDVALAALDALNRRGVEATLTIVGCDPDAARNHPSVAVHPFLNKNDPADYAKLTALFGDAHVFVLPTQADCTPMVVAEANAFATPVLITGTGGIPSLMAEGRNGRMLPVGASGEDYADSIIAITSDDVAYRRLSGASFAHYRNRLNWSAWARDVVRSLAAG